MESERKYKKLSFQDAYKFKNTYAYSNKFFFGKMWPIVYGDEVTVLAAAGSSTYITHYFRKQVKLRPFAKLTCYVPAVGLTAIFSDLIHSTVINAFVLDPDSCKLCTMALAGMTQVSVGVMYPLFMGPLISFYMADRLLTYPIPSITRAPWYVIDIWAQMTLKNYKPFLVSALIQFVVAATITYKKQECVKEYFESGDRSI